jgi:hypothetical protein
MQVSLKPAKFNGHSTCRPTCIYLSRLARFFLTFEMLETEFVEKIATHILHSLKFPPPQIPAACEIMWNKFGIVRQPTDDNIIRRVRTACWIT